MILDRRITLELPPSGRDSTGGPAGGPPVDTKVVWAAQDDQRARDQLLSGREDTMALTTFTINYRIGIDNRWRVRTQDSGGDYTYRVVGVLERGRREFLDLLCEAVK
jgi:SPP1 family predicted phage head-tail adaptor